MKQVVEVQALVQSGADPIQVLCSMNDTVATLAAQGIRARYPNLPEPELIAKLRDYFGSKRF